MEVILEINKHNKWQQLGPSRTKETKPGSITERAGNLNKFICFGWFEGSGPYAWEMGEAVSVAEKNDPNYETTGTLWFISDLSEPYQFKFWTAEGLKDMRIKIKED